MGEWRFPYIAKGAEAVAQGLEVMGDTVPGAKVVGQVVKDVTVGGLDKTLDVMPTAMRRTVRTLGIPQSIAQDIGDATHLIQEIGLIVLPTVRALRVERAATSMEVAQPKGITLTLEYKSEMNLRDFSRKARALQDLAERGKLVKAPNPVVRDPRITRQYRQGILKRADEVYGKNDPKKLEKIRERVSKMDVDHQQDLQIKGADARWNLSLLDSQTNQEIGRQIRQAIKEVADGTKITRVEIKRLD